MKIEEVWKSMNSPRELNKKANYYYETLKHKVWVFWYILKACWTLIKRGLVHDLSKFSPDEADIMAESLPKLRSTTYGSEEYKKLLEEIRPALIKHYQRNSHHPEYYHSANGFVRMSPLDRIEMLCDWKAATLRHDDGDITESITKNEERFNYNHFDKERLLADAEEIGLV